MMNLDVRRDSRVPNVPDERRSVADRRRAPRSGTPGRRAADVARAGAFAALSSLVASSMATAGEAPMKFGFDANSVTLARQLGMPVAYGSVWAGAWNQGKDGWGGIKDQLEKAKNNGVTPVIQWWYWGDDLSPTCMAQGCKDQYHGVWKDKATWDRLSSELADAIVRTLGPNSGAIIIVETEFNKSHMQTNDTFDRWLADKAEFFHGKGLKVVVGFGNWGREHWKNYARAVAAADMIGVQVLYSSVRDEAAYLSGADMLIGAAQYNKATFGKPSFVTDCGFSSYPTSSYERYQDTVIRDIFRRLGELRSAGVQGMIWRMLADDPKFNTANYHGMAEQHWGLVRADGSKKPGFDPFLNGMLGEADSQTASAHAAQARR